MEQIDLKLKLFCGEPIKVDGYGEVKPLTIKKIVHYGYSNYMKSLNLLCVEKEELLKGGESTGEDLDEIGVLDILIALGGEEIELELEKSLSLFLGGEAVVDKEELSVYIKFSESEVKIVNSSTFDKIVEVIKWQNYINHFEEKDLEVPMDEETRKFKEKMKKLQKKRDEIKRKKNQDVDEDENPDLYDIISSLSSKSYSINELNVMDLTVYQVYSKFKRLEVIDQYDISIKSILAGAKDIKLKHWSSKLTNT